MGKMPAERVATSSFPELLRQHRLSRVLTQAELAERSGLSERAISDLERGLKQAPRTSTVRLLVRGLGLPEAEAAALLRAAQSRRKPTPDLGPSQHNLPLPTTSFIARASELSQLEQALRESCLVTITGAGGCGKTRLALELARAHVERFANGVWLVELAPLAEGSLVTQTIAAAFGIPSSGRPPDEEVTEFLRNTQSLLVLDNCEHVVDACAVLIERLLRSCRGVRVLATSRERLGIPGEAVHRVSGLALPPEGAGAADVARSEAGQLFLERARQLVPELAVDEHGAAAVARICRRLDGIPLAIELAATAARALSLEDLALRLDDRFRLLRATGRTAPPRHKTLRAAMDWSHQLLDADEVRLFRRLAVFAGGFDIDALEAVHGPDALPVLLRLIDKSLVVVEWRGRGQRYRMLETVREYAQARLVESGDSDRLHARLATFLLGLAEPLTWERYGPRPAETLNRLGNELDNVRAALHWCIAEGRDPETGLGLGAALGDIWSSRGLAHEGRRWLAVGLERSAAAPTAAHAKARLAAGSLAQVEGDYEQAEFLAKGCLSWCRAAGEAAGTAAALTCLGRIARLRGDYPRAAALLEEGLAVRRATADTDGTAASLLALGDLARAQGADDQAIRHYEEALALQRPSVDAGALVLNNLAVSLRERGDYARARLLLEEALARWREAGFSAWQRVALLNLALVAHAQGDQARARALCVEGLVLARDWADRGSWLPRTLEVAAHVLVGTRGQASRAARLFGVARAHRAAIGAPMPSPEQADLERALSRARGSLGEVRLAQELAAGEAMATEQAVEYALAALGAAQPYATAALKLEYAPPARSLDN
jgi:predicted ATPase/DNA-binding XRE family transcriptional regulator